MEKTFRKHAAVAILTALCAARGTTHAQEAPAIPDSDTAQVDSQLPAESEVLESDRLTVEQARIADRFRRLEQVVLRLAELSKSTDPRRAALLRQAVAQIKEQDVDALFAVIVQLLEDEQLALASNNQQTAKLELAKLLELLLKENRSERIESEKRRVLRYLKQVNRLIKQQRGVKARNASGEEAGRLADIQSKIAKATEQLADGIAEDEKKAGETREEDADESKSADDVDPAKGKDAGEDSGGGKDAGKGKDKGKDGSKGEGKDSPEDDKSDNDQESADRNDQDQESDASPKDKGDEPESPEDSGKSDGKNGPSQDGKPSQPGDPGQPGSGGEQPDGPKPLQKHIRAAQKNMQQAQKALEDAERKGSLEQQQKALEALEKAKAELEEILRQLREEEVERMLAMLEARFRKMLALQNEVYEGTLRLNKVPLDQRDHDDEIEAGRLSRKESVIVREADKALTLLRDEGSSVAFPEVVEQMRDDMEQVVARLSKAEVGQITQDIEQDIIIALEEMIDALVKSQRQQESKPSQQPPGGQPGGESPLVDILAEIKMIRSLQLRVNKRTERYSKMIAGSQVEVPELTEGLSRLAVRQQRIQRATKDLHLGKNQ